MPLLRSFCHKIGLRSSQPALRESSDLAQLNPPSSVASREGRSAENDDCRFSDMVKLQQNVWIGHVQRPNTSRGASRSRSLDVDVEKAEPDLLNGQIMIKREITIKRDSR